MMCVAFAEGAGLWVILKDFSKKKKGENRAQVAQHYCFWGANSHEGAYDGPTD
jgi:hypothetical protein